MSTISVSRGRRGLTLAELLVVITIITIALTLILPVVLNLVRTQRVGSAARSIQAMLHGAQEMAVACRSVYGLTLMKEIERGPEAAEVHFACLVTDERDTAAARQKPEPLSRGLRLRLYAPRDALVPLDLPRAIRFRPDGTVDSTLACPIRISLENAADANDTLDILIRRGGMIEMGP